jgi:hypothetical protein
VCEKESTVIAYRVYVHGEYQQTIWISPEIARKMEGIGYELKEKE